MEKDSQGCRKRRRGKAGEEVGGRESEYEQVSGEREKERKKERERERFRNILLRLFPSLLQSLAMKEANEIFKSDVLKELDILSALCHHIYPTLQEGEQHPVRKRWREGGMEGRGRKWEREEGGGGGGGREEMYWEEATEKSSTTNIQNVAIMYYMEGGMVSERQRQREREMYWEEGTD